MGLLEVRQARQGRLAARQVPISPASTFRNGVALNFKQTDFQSGGVEIRVRFGHGERGLSAADRMPMMLAAGLFPNGGLGKMDFAQIGEALANSTWAFTLEARPTAFVLNSSTLTDNVDQEMRLLAAYMTDPGFRPLIDEKLPTALDLSYRMLGTDPPMRRHRRARAGGVFPGRESLPPREHIAAYRAADFERMLKPVADPVADRGDDRRRHHRGGGQARGGGDLRRAAAAPGAALRRRTAPARSATSRSLCRRRSPRPTTGPADKAAAVLAWPLYVATPGAAAGGICDPPAALDLRDPAASPGAGGDGQGLCARASPSTRPTMPTRASSPSTLEASSGRHRPADRGGARPSPASSPAARSARTSSTPPERPCSPRPTRRSATMAPGRRSSPMPAQDQAGAARADRPARGPRGAHPRGRAPRRRHLAGAPRRCVSRALPAPR